MNSGSLAWMEVPIIRSEAVSWTEVSVHSSVHPLNADTTASHPVAPPARDAASCSVVGDPPAYLIWRIHASMPHVLELLELCPSKEFPRVGLRITFPDALCPFTYICKSEVECASGFLFLLYALTVSGVAYLFKLKSFHLYVNGSAFRSNEMMRFHLQTNPNNEVITAVAATAGSLIIGRSDGSVGCFQLCMLDQTSPGFVHELRDDLGLGRLWGLMSWGRSAGAVLDLVVSEFPGRKLAFVLHLNGILRVWDLLNYSKVFSQTLDAPMLAGAMAARLWVGESDHETGVALLAVLLRGTLEDSYEMMHVYSFHFCPAGNPLFLDPSVHSIPLKEGKLIDVVLISNRILVLKESGLTSYILSNTEGLEEDASRCHLQESVVADQLFQCSEHSSDKLIQIINSLDSSTKDQTAPFLSSIFLRRLLNPGVHLNTALHATFHEFNRHWKDSEFQSLSADGLRKEILSVIECEGFSENLTSLYHRWKIFVARYFHNWCKNNAPFGFLVDVSAGAVGLIRQNSVSLFRSLEDIELLDYDLVDYLGDFVNPGLHLSKHENEILFKVLCCINSVSHQLGKSASIIFYESIVKMQVDLSKDIIRCLMKMLEMGFSSSSVALRVSDIGEGMAREKTLSDHKKMRMFSVDMVLSLRALHKKAITWEGVLNVIKVFFKKFVPKKLTQNIDLVVNHNVKSSIIVQATSQVAEVMFQSAFSLLLLLRFLVDIGDQINMSHDDIAHVQLELVPMLEDIVIEWIVIHFFGTTACESPAVDDFSSQLSSLHIDGHINKKSWQAALGKCDFVLAFILLLNSWSSSCDAAPRSLRRLPNPHGLTSSVRDFATWIFWGSAGNDFPAFFFHGTELALVLLKHGQYDAAVFLLAIMDAHSRKEKVSESFQSTSGKWCTHFHLLGCCFLAQAHYRLQGILKERKLSEAIQCFFRASYGEGAPQAVQRLSHEIGLFPIFSAGDVPAAAWKLQYFQWAMQIFEQFGFSEGACRFALAALEQVDEAFHCKNYIDNESEMAVRGRLWANVFKFSIDLNNFNDAYCALISNKDEESKYICLRRLITVLYERCAVKVLCDGNLPFIGLREKVEQELARKAERSDIFAKPSPYKLLYSFEMHRHNWRRAAGYIYQYTVRLKTEAPLKGHQHETQILQERLNGLSAAINALHLLYPAYAWIDSPFGGNSIGNEYPSKKSKKSVEGKSGNAVQPQILRSYIDAETLEEEFVLTSAEHLLSMANTKCSFNGAQSVPSNLVTTLTEMNFHDMAFTVILKFWKGSALRSELERLFSALSLKCCPNSADYSLVGNHLSKHPLLPTSMDETFFHGSFDANQQPLGNNPWETLELYLEKYRKLHRALPVIVAATFLRANPQIGLPHWLVNMFKGDGGDGSFGMSGGEADPASLFRLYVEYGRYMEATCLLVGCMEKMASMRPRDLIRRKRPFAVWFPYTAIERLWCQLEELGGGSGHVADHCENLKMQVHKALHCHLQLLKSDSDDALSRLPDL